jgi:uncharacterized membrane protein
VPALVYGVVLAVLVGIMYGALFATAPSYSDYSSYGSSYSFDMGFGWLGMLIMFIGGIVIAVVAAAIQSAFLGGLLDIADGKPVESGSFFKPRNIGNVVIAGLLVGIATAIGSALCYLPGLIVGLFTIFTTVFIVDRNLGAIDGIKASFDLVKTNFGPAILTYLIVGVIMVIGAAICGIGLIVAAPVAQLFLVYAYRKLTGGEVAALTP